MSGSHLNSLKSGFYPHHHTETRLARVSVFQFAIFNKPFTSQDSQYCWLLFSSQKCLINILEDTPLLASLALIILCFLLLVSFSSTCLTDSQSSICPCYFPPLLNSPWEISPTASAFIIRNKRRAQLPLLSYRSTVTDFLNSFNGIPHG